MPKALILGGTEDHITLVRSLKNRGYRTILLDYFDNPPARETADLFVQESILDIDAVVSVAEREKPELVVATCIDQALLTVAYVSEKMGLPCHLSHQKALHLTNKAYMKKLFSENGIPTSMFTVIEDSARETPSELTYPLVVKPSDSNSSKGIRKILRKDELDDAVTKAMQQSRSRKVIVEEYIDGEEYSVDVVIKDGKAAILMISKNIKIKQNTQSFTILQNIYLAEVDEKVEAAIKDVSEKIAQAFGLDNVPLLVQLLVKNNRISVIEFSSRIGGGSKHHFIKRMSGFDILNYFIDVLTGKPTAVNVSKFPNYASMNYIYSQPGIFHGVDGIDELKQEGVIEDYYCYKTPGMTIANNSSSADRPAGFMVIANSQKELDEKTLYIDSKIKVLGDNNKDIMMHGLFEDAMSG